MIEIDNKEKNYDIVSKLYRYAVAHGIETKTACVNDSSPYFLLNDDTSISYRKHSRKWDKSGIVIFCSADKYIKNKLVSKLGLVVDDNSTDPIRPYAIFVPTELFDEVLNIIK